MQISVLEYIVFILSQHVVTGYYSFVNQTVACDTKTNQDRYKVICIYIKDSLSFQRKRW